jgi:hypothetical protein
MYNDDPPQYANVSDTKIVVSFEPEVATDQYLLKFSDGKTQGFI